MIISDSGLLFRATLYVYMMTGICSSVLMFYDSVCHFSVYCSSLYVLPDIKKCIKMYVYTYT